MKKFKVIVPVRAEIEVNLEATDEQTAMEYISKMHLEDVLDMTKSTEDIEFMHIEHDWLESYRKYITEVKDES